MNWSLPYSVEIEGETFKIRNKCDYRVVLNTIKVLTNESYSVSERIGRAIYTFYEDNIDGCKDIVKAYEEMSRIINGGEDEAPSSSSSGGNKPRLMDWEHDFKWIAPAVSRVLGYEVRDPDRTTHWISFLGAYMEIGECTFATIISIRSKRAKGKKLEKWEEEFFREHRNDIILPQKITADEQEILDSQW